MNGWVSWRELTLGLSIVFLCLLTLPLYFLRKIVAQPKSYTHTARPKTPNLTELLKQPLFITLAISFSGCGAAMSLIDIHLVPLIHERLMQHDTHGAAQVTAASTLSLLGVMELLGCLLVSYVADRVNNTGLLSGLYATRVLALIILLFADQYWDFIGFGMLFGMTYMGTVVITSMSCLRAYRGVRGSMFGLLFLCHQIAVFLVAWLGGALHDITGHYNAIILVVLAVSAISSVTSLRLGRDIRQAHADSVHQNRPLHGRT